MDEQDCNDQRKQLENELGGKRFFVHGLVSVRYR